MLGGGFSTGSLWFGAGSLYAYYRGGIETHVHILVHVDGSLEKHTICPSVFMPRYVIGIFPLFKVFFLFLIHLL